MKKFLFWILAFLWIWLSFCSADYFYVSPLSSIFDYIYVPSSDFNTSWYYYSDSSMLWKNILVFSNWWCSYNFYDSEYNFLGNWWVVVFNFSNSSSLWLQPDDSCGWWVLFTYLSDSISWWWWWSSPSDITVYYNNWQSSTGITCDWTQAIEIEGLSTITSTNTFTPYFNIDYIDENNQLLTESYSKDILYLSWTTFKKTYTWNNIRILTAQWSSESIFTWYVPVFDVSGTTQPVDTEYNMFNNFADNSLKVLLSNIPWYIQYVFIIWIILLLIWIVKMLKRRK